MASVSGGACSWVIRESGVANMLADIIHGGDGEPGWAADGRARRVYRMNDGPRCSGRRASTYISGFRVPCVVASLLLACLFRRRSTRRVGSAPFPFDRFFRREVHLVRRHRDTVVVVVWRFRHACTRTTQHHHKETRKRSQENESSLLLLFPFLQFYFYFFFFFLPFFSRLLSFLARECFTRSIEQCNVFQVTVIVSSPVSSHVLSITPSLRQTSTRHKNRSRGLNGRQYTYIYVYLCANLQKKKKKNHHHVNHNQAPDKITGTHRVSLNNVTG